MIDIIQEFAKMESFPVFPILDYVYADEKGDSGGFDHYAY